MIEAITCFFLISFPLAVWFFFRVAKRMHRPDPHDDSLLGKLLSSSDASWRTRASRDDDRPATDGS